ncbi:MAG: radical SAM protein [Candidatus Bathyarchaeota archaeon]|nr:radical SAM protein [Candidatus Bathyarchaeota archaeon]
MPVKYEEVNIKSALGDLGVLNTRLWTKHCFDPYTNCEFNCVYCNTSAVRHTASEELSVPVCVKVNAPQVLAEELSRLKKKGVVSIGLAMDAYQPVEKKYRLTRRVLEVFKEHSCPFAVGTKSDLILRDIDVIAEASKKAPCIVSLSITTLDESLAKQLEPNAASPKRRLETLRRFSEAGVNTGVWISPILPYITDTEENIGEIVEAAVKNGAKFVLGGALDMRSPAGIQKFLKAQYPHLAPKYEQLYRQPDGSYSYYPDEAYLYVLYRRFISQCRRFHVERYMPHFHTRQQAFLFYIRNFAFKGTSISELTPVLNYLFPSQEILQTLHLRLRNRAFTRNLLKSLGYFPH